MKNTGSGSGDKKVKDEDWFISTVTEEHVTIDRDNFAKYEKFENPRVFMVLGREFKSVGVGEVETDLHVKKEGKKIRLVDDRSQMFVSENLDQEAAAAQV